MTKETNFEKDAYQRGVEGKDTYGWFNPIPSFGSEETKKACEDAHDRGINDRNLANTIKDTLSKP